MLSIKKQYHNLKVNKNLILKDAESTTIALRWVPLTPKIFEKLISTTHFYDLYSDFVASNIWAYMGSKALLCFLDEGVAIRMLDDYTNEPYYTLISNESSSKLLDQIILHDDKKNDSLQLRHVPKETVKALKHDYRILKIEYDRDNHDYIYSVDRFINLNTLKLRSRKKELLKFQRTFPNIEIKYGLQSDQDLVRDMKKLYKLWIEQTHQKKWEKDYSAFERILKQSVVPQIIVGIYNEGEMIGFTVNELIHKGYYMGFSGKANRKYPGLSISLEHETAKLMKSKYGCTYLNLEQDLGIKGLRNYKLSLSPERLIKKYKVTVSTAVKI